jgi:hypothetical protein
LGGWEGHKVENVPVFQTILTIQRIGVKLRHVIRARLIVIITTIYFFRRAQMDAPFHPNKPFQRKGTNLRLELTNDYYYYPKNKYDDYYYPKNKYTLPSFMFCRI